MHMARSKLVTKCVLNITHIHDQLVVMEKYVDEVELANVVLSEFLMTRDLFFKEIYARENDNSFIRLWDEYNQEEMME